MIKKINASFEVLSDRNKRIEYDRTGIDALRSTKADAYNNDKKDNATERSHHDPFHSYYDYNDTSKTHSAYKHDDNYYTVRGTHKNSLDKEMNVGMQTMVTDIDTPKGRFHIIVEPSLCMAFGSCETIAPGANHEAILAAAQTCPTKAIKIIDCYTGEQLFP